MQTSVQIVEKQPTPPLLPILRSEQQARILTLLLGDPDLELNLTELSTRTGAPHPSVHREIERAEAAGIVRSRRVGNVRLVRANTDSPYHHGLADVLTKAFGVPHILARALRPIAGVDRALVFGSWAACFHGVTGAGPVGDIDLLILGEPDRDALHEELHAVGERLGRPVQVTVRATDWFETGSESFHDTVTARPLVELDLAGEPGVVQPVDSATATASTAS